MKNIKSTKVFLNGILLAAAAAVGVSAYQIITSPIDGGIIPDEVQVQMSEKNEEEEAPALDANTSDVTAALEMEETPVSPEETTGDENVEVSAENIAFEIERSEADEEEKASEDWQETEEAEETNGGAASAVLPASAYLEFSESTLMEWPVHGNILLDYDMEQTTYFPTLDQYRLSPAIAVQSVQGAPVVAAAEGVVFDIKEDAKTGTTVTMELGNGYQAIYGQLCDLTVYEGEVVSKGTTIGYVAAPTIYYSAEGSNLYFAMKKDGKPIDPILYLP